MMKINIKTIVMIVLMSTLSSHISFAQNKGLLKAAIKGKIEAQIEIGNYYLGMGNYPEAVAWYRKAADKNNEKAQYLLGYCYDNGLGIAKDSIIAVEWYTKAAARNNSEAIEALKKMGRYNLGGDSYMEEASTSLPQVQEQTPKFNSSELKKQQKQNSQKTVSSSMNPPKQLPEVDRDLPTLAQTNISTFAIIIANESYQREANVDYAQNDGNSFYNYCVKLLGLPEKNVHYVPNGTLNNLIYELDWISQVCKAYGGEASVIFYYAGHGIPDEANGQAYLLPIDGLGKNLRTCYKISELYQTLGNLPAQKVTVFLDACFSGANRDGKMLMSARGVAIKSKVTSPVGKMVVLSAAQGDETAYPYKEQQHGLFTYFLLKKLKETAGEASLGELSEYIRQQVTRYSIIENGKSQTPIATSSPNLTEKWQSMKLK